MCFPFLSFNISETKYAIKKLNSDILTTLKSLFDQAKEKYIAIFFQKNEQTSRYVAPILNLERCF